MFSQYQCGRANGLNRARSAPLRHAEQAAEPGVAARSLVIWRSTRGGRSLGRGREVVRSDGRPTVDGDLGLSLDGRSRGWVNRWVDRSGQIRSWLRSARVGAGHLEVLGSKSPFVIGRRIWISHHSDRALMTKG